MKIAFSLIAFVGQGAGDIDDFLTLRIVFALGFFLDYYGEALNPKAP